MSSYVDSRYVPPIPWLKPMIHHLDVHIYSFWIEFQNFETLCHFVFFLFSGDTVEITKNYWFGEFFLRKVRLKREDDRGEPKFFNCSFKAELLICHTSSKSSRNRYNHIYIASNIWTFLLASHPIGMMIFKEILKRRNRVIEKSE